MMASIIELRGQLAKLLDQKTTIVANLLITLITVRVDVNEQITAAEQLAGICPVLTGSDKVIISQEISRLMEKNIPKRCKEILRPHKSAMRPLPKF